MDYLCLVSNNFKFHFGLCKRKGKFHLFRRRAGDQGEKTEGYGEEIYDEPDRQIYSSWKEIIPEQDGEEIID